MPRQAKITVRRDNRNPALPFAVNIPAALSVSRKRERPHYPTLGEANRRKHEEERRLAKYAERALGLSDPQKQEAAECNVVVAKYGKTLRDAVAVAARIWETDAASVTIDEVSEALLLAKEQDGRSRDSLRQIRSVMARFAAAHSGQIVSTFTSAQIDLWLRGLKREDGAALTGVSRNTYRRTLSLAFTFAKVQGWTKENPVSMVARAAGGKEEVVFLAPSQVEKLLAAANPSIIAYVALCAFAGLRPSEAAKLRWTDISHDRIRIRAATAKTRRNRWVPVQPNLLEWLAKAERAKDGLVGFSRTRFREAYIAAGWEPGAWPADCLRHSFGTYRGLIIGEDDLAREMGNSPAVIINHYRGLSDRKTADAYFSILPNTTATPKPPPQVGQC